VGWLKRRAAHDHTVCIWHVASRLSTLVDTECFRAGLAHSVSDSEVYSYLSRAGANYAPKACLATIGSACLYGISIAARGETRNEAVRVNEFRLGSLTRRDAEADARQNIFSNLKVGAMVAELAMSTQKGEVKIVGNEQLAPAALDIDKLSEAGIC
jgi:hypothetical protein